MTETVFYGSFFVVVEKEGLIRNYRDAIPQIKTSAGNVPFVTFGWGEHLTIEQMIDPLTGGYDVNRPERATKLGMPAGWNYRNKPELTEEEFDDLQIGYVTQMAEMMFRARNWDGVGNLILTSDTITPEGFQTAANDLRKQFKIDSLVYVRAAHNGFSFALSSFGTEQLRGDRNILLSSNSVMADGMPALTFGNAGFAMAFEDNEVVTNFIETQVIQDESGSIRIPRRFADIPNSNMKAFPWITFESGTEDNFIFSRNGDLTQIVVRLPIGDNGKFEMDGIETHKYFRATVPEFLVENLTNYYRDFPNDYLRNGSIHNPSKKVFDIIMSLTGKRLNGNGHTLPNYSYVLNETGNRNTFATTGAIVLARLVQKGAIKPNEHFHFVGYGPGSTQTGAGMRING